jgi:branched-chain amino acid transport system ATP-binding protein
MLAFGRGLLSNPKLFLFDEPSLGIAPIIVHEIGERVRQLADEGYTIILVEQNAILALELAEKAYVLETGRVALEGEAKQLKNNEYVKKVYLGI